MPEVAEFFRRILPASGWFYTVAILPEGGAKHRAYKTAEAVRGVDWALSNWNKQYNVYFTPCTWSQPYVQNDKGKNKNCRKRDDLVHRLRCFWLDIDSAKAGKTLKQSATELHAFCKTTGLPLPNAVVKTGGGLHVYWAFDEEISLEQWRPMAQALQNACKLHGFDVDHVCTTDSARVLRLPSSRNRKYSGAPVAELSSLGEPYQYADIATVLVKYKSESSDVNDEFSHKSGVQYVPGRMALVAEQCLLVAKVAETGGAECDEPLWKALLHLCSHAIDGTEWAHKLSVGHPDYTVLATDRKFNECDTSIPPTWCTTLETRYGAGAPCADCTHHGRIKSPMVLGHDKSEGSIVKPDSLPDGYFLSSGGVFLNTTNKDGDEIVLRICQVPILDLKVHDVLQHGEHDDAVIPHLQIMWVDRQNRPHRGMVEYTALSDYRTTFVALAKIKFPYSKSDHKNGFDTFMTNWVQRLRDVGAVTIGKPQYGWHVKANNEIEGFAVAKTMYMPNGGTKTMPWPETQLNHVYSTAGTLEKWQAAVRLLQKRERPEIMTILAAAFAAPLFTFLGESSAVISAVSKESGVGKSTAMRVAQAVWGNPKIGLTSLDDTVKSVARKMGVIRHLPVFWDELRLTAETAEPFLQMMFQLSQGRERSRLSSNIDFRETGTWETVLMCAGNTPLLNFAASEDVQSNANLKRLFEYEIPFDGMMPSSAEGTEIFNDLRSNYGHAGVRYAQFLVDNFERIRNEVVRVNKEVFGALGARNDDRFWIGTITALILGAQYALESGLVEFDVEGIKTFLFKVYLDMQKAELSFVDLNTSSRLMQELLIEFSHCGIVYAGHTPKPGPQTEWNTVKRLPRDTRDVVTWEYYPDDGTLRILQSRFAAWAKRTRRHPRDVLSKLTREGYRCREMRVFFGKGTPLEAISRVYVYEIVLPEADRAYMETISN